jgi:hypothetical protein
VPAGHLNSILGVGVGLGFLFFVFCAKQRGVRNTMRDIKIKYFFIYLITI